jgi:triosephosphate isomerase
MLIAGNWKMYKGAHQARAFAAQLVLLPGRAPEVEIVVCPPFVSLDATIQGLGTDSGISVYAQNVHWELEGAYTGEVSPPMLLELGVTGAIVGHSERRQNFGETDATVGMRAEGALEAGLRVIACVGETEEEREAQETERKLRHQVQSDLAAVDASQLAEVVIAYEPIWAIGTGKTATPEQAQDAIAFVRALIRDRDADVAVRVRILYGGSVKAANAAELLALPDVDGALVGGASLDPGEFAAIVSAAPS